MARRVAAVLLTLSLASLLLAADAVVEDSKAEAMIRLPSDGQGLGMAASTRPWKCCDRSICALTYPPICFCTDKVERCDDACKNCEQDEYSDLYYCRDQYQGIDQGPKCTNGATVAAAAAGGN